MRSAAHTHRHRVCLSMVSGCGCTDSRKAFILEHKGVRDGRLSGSSEGTLKRIRGPGDNPVN